MTRWYIILIRDPPRAVGLIFELGFCQSQNGLATNTARCKDADIVEMIVTPQPSILKRRFIHFVVLGNQVNIFVAIAKLNKILEFYFYSNKARNLN